MSELLDHLDQTIRARGLFHSGQRILVAVSGGVDSMVLLHLLYALAPKHGWRLTVAHLNHQLRGRSSDADERLVRRTAQRLKLPVVVERVAVAQLARARKLSVEMAARDARHSFLARIARRQHISTIALAHHADDQLELFFLRLLRGSGGEGLAGMKWRASSASDSQVELIRPLLDQPKAALLEYAKENQVQFREDASNAVLDFQRNRIRHELLPLLRRKYQPALDKTLLRVMDILGADAEFAAAAARAWLGESEDPKAEVRGPNEGRRVKSEEGGADSALTKRPLSGKKGGRRRVPFDKLPVAVQRRCVQFQLVRLGIIPDYELVERLSRETNRPVSVGRPTLKEAAGNAGETPVLHCVVRDRSGMLHLRPAAREEFSSKSLRVDLHPRAGELSFGGARLSWQIGSGAKHPRVGPARRAGQSATLSRGRPLGERALPTSADPQTEFFDADKVGSPIRLRHWQPGDRFQPIGMPGPVKLQDIFTNVKVPRPLRRRLIVAIAANREIFWVEGLRIAERFKLTERTIRRLQWRWKRL